MSKKEASMKQEKLISSMLGWDVVKGSGARHLHPGDVYSNEWLGECKTHVQPGKMITFSYSVWNKIVDEATSLRRYPVLFVDDGSQTISKTWCMCNILPPESCEVVSYPLRLHKSSISFNHDSMLKLKNLTERQISKPIIYNVNMGGSSAYLMNFQDFLSFYEE